MSMRQNLKPSPSTSSSALLNGFKLVAERNGNEITSQSFSVPVFQNEPIVSSSSSTGCRVKTVVSKNVKSLLSSSPRPPKEFSEIRSPTSSSSHIQETIQNSEQSNLSSQNQHVNFVHDHYTHSFTPGLVCSTQNQNVDDMEFIKNQDFRQKPNRSQFDASQSSSQDIPQNNNDNETGGEGNGQMSQSPGASSSSGFHHSWPINAASGTNGCSGGNNLHLTSLPIVPQSQSTQALETRRIVSHHQLVSNERRPPLRLTSLRSRSSFSIQLVQVRRRQLAAGRLEEEEGSEVSSAENSRTLVTLRMLSNHHEQSNDSLHVNVNEDEMNNNEDFDPLDQLMDDGGDELALHESSSSSSSESANGRGDAVSGTPSSTESDTEGSMTTVASLSSFSNEDQVAPGHFENKNFMGGTSGKYGTLAVDLRPRPAFGHRYVISANEVHSRRRNNCDKESRLLPSWLPTYAQRIECILQEFIMMESGVGCQQEAEETLSQPHQNDDHPDPASFELVYVRLKGDPPSRLLEFDDSSESEESCIRSISTDTRRRKSCLKIAPRDGGSVGESRPKNLSWSQHIYIAQILEEDDEGDSKTRSCPAIYYMGQFSIQGRLSGEEGKSLVRKGRRQKRKKRRIIKMVASLFLSCLRCQPSPPRSLIDRLSSSPTLTQQQKCPNVVLVECRDGINKSVEPAKSKTNLGGVFSAFSVMSRRYKSSKIEK